MQPQAEHEIATTGITVDGDCNITEGQKNSLPLLVKARGFIAYYTGCSTDLRIVAITFMVNKHTFSL